MEIVVVNGANSIARGTLSKLANKGYTKIKMLDYRPFRNSVYQWQRDNQNITVQKELVQNLASLQLELEGAQDVLYFTHDYPSMSASKNSFIQKTAIIAKKQGVKKFVAVCPIEYDLIYSEDSSKNAIDQRNEAELHAFSNFEDMTLLRPNLTNGLSSYLVHYLTQCTFAGKAPASLTG